MADNKIYSADKAREMTDSVIKLALAISLLHIQAVCLH